MEDLEEILRVYGTARRYMRAHGNPTQWGDDYPSRALLEEDIRRRQLYVDEEGGAVHGVFAFILGAVSYTHLDVYKRQSLWC